MACQANLVSCLLNCTVKMITHTGTYCGKVFAYNNLVDEFELRDVIGCDSQNWPVRFTALRLPFIVVKKIEIIEPSPLLLANMDYVKQVLPALEAVYDSGAAASFAPIHDLSSALGQKILNSQIASNANVFSLNHQLPGSSVSCGRNELRAAATETSLASSPSFPRGVKAASRFKHGVLMKREGDRIKSCIRYKQRSSAQNGIETEYLEVIRSPLSTSSNNPNSADLLQNVLNSTIPSLLSESMGALTLGDETCWPRTGLNYSESSIFPHLQASTSQSNRIGSFGANF